MRVVVLVLLVACGTTRHAVEHGGGPPVARAKVRTLAQKDRIGGRDAVVFAETREQLADLWKTVGLAGAPPHVNFKRDVVLGANYHGGVCEWSPEGARIDANRVLTLELFTRRKSRICILLGVRVARVFAVPRSLLPSEFTWKHQGRAFEIALGRSASAFASRARPALSEVAGEVALPAPGKIALRALADGTQVWVAHHPEGHVAVVRADGPDGNGYLDLGVALGWDDATQKLRGKFDSYGRTRSQDRLELEYHLQIYEHEQHGDRLRIGPPYHISTNERPTGYRLGSKLPENLPASSQLELEGPARPYTELAPVPFDTIADGKLGLVDLDLVIANGTVRLCRASEHPSGCPESAPLYDVRVRKHALVEVIAGPLLVRRAGNAVRSVVHFGK
jgi:hypothetical protein